MRGPIGRAVLAVACLALAACGTAAPATPTPDVAATIQAGVAATLRALPSPTRPAPTATSIPPTPALPSTLDTAAIGRAMGAAKSFRLFAHVTRDGKSTDTTAEYSAPNRVHATVAVPGETTEVIQIGGETYVKQGAGAWVRGEAPSEARSVTRLADPSEISALVGPNDRVRPGAASSVDGQPCQVFVIETESTSGEVCVSPDNRIVGITFAESRVEVFDFDTTLDIRAPAAAIPATTPTVAP